MSFVDWLRESAGEVREHGLDGLRESLYQLYLGAWKRSSIVYDEDVQRRLQELGYLE